MLTLYIVAYQSLMRLEQHSQIELWRSIRTRTHGDW